MNSVVSHHTSNPAVILNPSLPGGTEPLSSCMVLGSMTRASTYGETLGVDEVTCACCGDVPSD